MDMLEKKLIDHYKCFQTETLWVDEHNEDDGFFVHPVHTRVSPRLCRWIAKFCKKHIDHEKYPFIYVGAYVFKTSKL